MKHLLVAMCCLATPALATGPHPDEIMAKYVMMFPNGNSLASNAAVPMWQCMEFGPTLSMMAYNQVGPHIGYCVPADLVDEAIEKQNTEGT